MRVTTESRATLEILRISIPSLTAPGITFIAPGTTSTTPTVPTTGGSSCMDAISSIPRMNRSGAAIPVTTPIGLASCSNTLPCSI